MENVKFDVMWKDHLCARVEVTDDKAHITKYDTNPVHCLFPYEETDSYHILSILESRCWPRDRGNIDELLKACGLHSYDVMGIIKATHGRMYNDYTWIRFEGESLTYEEMKLRD